MRWRIVLPAILLLSAVAIGGLVLSDQQRYEGEVVSADTFIYELSITERGDNYRIEAHITVSGAVRNYGDVYLVAAAVECDTMERFYFGTVSSPMEFNNLSAATMTVSELPQYLYIDMRDELVRPNTNQVVHNQGLNFTGQVSDNGAYEYTTYPIQGPENPFPPDRSATKH